MTTIEIAPGSEIATAVFTSPQDDGVDYQRPLLIGYYPDNDEIWIELEGEKFNIQQKDVNALCKQLKRAAMIAAEQALT